MITISDDRMILFLVIAFFLGTLWGYWLGHGDASYAAWLKKRQED